MPPSRGEGQRAPKGQMRAGRDAAGPAGLRRNSSWKLVAARSRPGGLSVQKTLLRNERGDDGTAGLSGVCARGTATEEPECGTRGTPCEEEERGGWSRADPHRRPSSASGWPAALGKLSLSAPVSSSVTMPRRAVRIRSGVCEDWHHPEATAAAR